MISLFLNQLTFEKFFLRSFIKLLEKYLTRNKTFFVNYQDCPDIFTVFFPDLTKNWSTATADAISIKETDWSTSVVNIMSIDPLLVQAIIKTLTFSSILNPWLYLQKSTVKSTKKHLFTFSKDHLCHSYQFNVV